MTLVAPPARAIVNEKVVSPSRRPEGSAVTARDLGIISSAEALQRIGRAEGSSRPDLRIAGGFRQAGGNQLVGLGEFLDQRA